MKSSTAKLRKLRGKSLHELNVRGRQQLAKLNERVLGRGMSEMSDGALLREINPISRNGNAEGSAILILERIRSATSSLGRSSKNLPFFPSLMRRSEVSAVLRQRFPEERAALLERAERAMLGRFDLLGFEDLNFGDPIDWSLDPTTGKRTARVHWSKINYLDPAVAGDKKVTWELNRHAHFVTLGQAYWLTGDERFSDAFVAQASSWMNSNAPKLGINWASSLELAFRVIAWRWALHLFAESDRLTPKFVSRFVKYLVAQGRHIEAYLSHYFSPNTHLTGEALGLFYLGASLPELARAESWRETGLRILLEQLPRHIRGDGVYFEQSSYYHRYTVDFYTHLLALADQADVALPRDVEQKLSMAFDHLMFITRPDGSSPFYGDDDGGRLLTLNSRRSTDFRDTLAIGAALFERGDWKFVAGKAPVEALWLLGPEALERYDRIESHPPSETSRASNESGYFVMRDGWSRESSYVLADCGPHGAQSCAHAHADALAFEFAAEGKTWLIDPGTFTYTRDAIARDQFRTSEAHNTITVDGQSQSTPSGPFGWVHKAESRVHQFVSGKSFDYFEGSHNGYERLVDPVTHTRSLLFLKADEACELPPYLIVRDQLMARSRHSYSLRYHFAPCTSAIARKNEVKALDAAGSALSVRVFGKSELESRTEEGWVSECYGKRVLCPVALFEAEGEGPQVFVSLMIPQNICKDDPPRFPLVEEQAVPLGQEGAATDCPPYKSYSIDTDNSRDVVLIGQQATELEQDLMTASGSIAWARFIDGSFKSGCLIGGSSYRVRQQLAINSAKDASSIAVSITGNQIEISIHDATRFDLSLDIPSSRIVVNNSVFDLPPGSRMVSFALDDSGWKLSKED
jgi:uncharacterized heparinase superfamily protein